MIRVTAPAGGLPGVCNCSLVAALLALCSATPAQAEDLQQPVPASASAAGEVTTATPITGEPTPVPAYDGYSSAAAAEMAARYRAPSLGGGRSLNTSQRSTASLWRDTDAPTRSVWRVGLAPSLPSPQMVGGPPPASPHVELALTARVERFDGGFKPRSAADAWKELGTFRLQLGGSNEMLLKPRRGGLSLSWQSKF